MASYFLVTLAFGTLSASGHWCLGALRDDFSVAVFNICFPGDWPLPSARFSAACLDGDRGGQHFHEQELAQAPATSAAWLGGAGCKGAC